MYIHMRIYVYMYIYVCIYNIYIWRYIISTRVYRICSTFFLISDIGYLNGGKDTCEMIRTNETD